MIKIVNLQPTLNPISAAERVKINQNWDIIKQKLSSLQSQISFLSGNDNLEELINRISTIIVDADNAVIEVNEAIRQINVVLPQVNSLVENATTATNSANEAAVFANEAGRDAEMATTQANATIADALTAITDAINATSNAVIATSNATTATDNANSATINANNAAQRAETVSDNLQGYEQPSTPFSLNTTFLKYQHARFNGSTYQAKVETTGNPLPIAPSVENEWWTLTAQRGVDGTGAVSSVNGILPNANGDVILPDNEELTKLVSNQFVVPATSNGQTQITIPLGNFNKLNDTLILIRNTTVVPPNGYSVEGNVITLSEPVVNAAETTFHMLIFKTVLTNDIPSDVQQQIEEITNQLTRNKKDSVVLSDYESLMVGENDWTLALRRACLEYRRVIIDRQIFITDTVDITNTTITGQSKNGAQIIGKITDPTKPMIKMGSFSVLSTLEVGYSAELITGTEAEGERVVVLLTGGSGGYALQKCKAFDNVKVRRCGTGITDSNSFFSVSIEDVEVLDFTYAGMIFNSSNRTGNIYKNIYIHNIGNNYEPMYGFRLAGEESETTILQLNVEHSKFKENAISFYSTKNITVSTIHLEGVELVGATAFVSFERSFGNVESLSVYFTRGHKPNQKLIEFKQASILPGGVGGTARSNLNAQITIGSIYTKGLNRPKEVTYPSYPNAEKTLLGNGVQPFYFMYRDPSYTDNYSVSVGKYHYYTYTGFYNDNSKYEEFLYNADANLSIDLNSDTRKFREFKKGNNLKFAVDKIDDSIYFSEISLSSVVGRPPITSMGVSPTELSVSENPIVNIGGANYTFEGTLRSTIATSDEYDIVSGIYTKRVNEYIFRSSTTVASTGNDFVIYNIQGVPSPTANGLTLCSHLADGYARVEFNAFYLRRDVLQRGGVILTSDSATDAIAKIKAYFEDQYNAGTPFTLWVTSPTPVQMRLNPNLVTLSKVGITTSTPNTIINAGYDIATNKHAWYDAQIEQLRTAVTALEART